MNRHQCFFKTCLLLSAILLILASVVNAQNKKSEEKRALALQVIDKATREPIPNAKLGIRIMRDRREDKTDSEGQCKIVMGTKEPDYIRVEVKKEGYVPIRLNWRKGPGRPGIPNQYTLALEKGTSIGGIIQDEQGYPIEGVSVYLLVPSGNNIERVAIWDHVEKTNAKGRWQCDIIPSKLDEITIRLAHPDYISDGMYGKTPRPSIEKLRNMTGVMTMRQGFVLTGRVFDANDQPIAGASVAQGSTRFSNSPSTQTDSEGRFRFENARPGPMVLNVQAEGYAIALKDLTLNKEMEPIEFHLEPGHTIRGRIVDTEGNPITGAFVAADSYRGHRALKWRVDTDAEGRFEWNEAPADEVLFDMSKQGYMGVRQYAMIPSGQEYEITLLSELRVSGKVVDAETGEPITEFKLLSAVDRGEDQPISWRRYRPKTYSNGQYDTRYTYPHPPRLIRIEAVGYKPKTSRPIESDEGEVTIDFALEKGMGPSGIVRLPDGKPAAEAEVILHTPSRGPTIRNGRNQRRLDSQYVETKEDGNFSFPLQSDAYAIVVLHDEGYLEVSESEFAESSELTLQSWATVKGRVLTGKNPVVNETVRLGIDNATDHSNTRIVFDYQAVTDSNGTFVFERVPPGQVRISRLIPINNRMKRFGHSMNVEAKAGQTTSVTIGGMGRPVMGKVLVPDYLKEKFDWQHTDYGLRIDSSEGPYRQLGFKIEIDGTFRIEDVPAGDYYLYLNAYGPPAPHQTFRGERIALLSQRFTIPEMPDGRSDEPFDLGVLELDVMGKSDYVPSLIGKPLSELNDIKIDLTPEQAKGKMVLVCFFDMNQRPSRHCVTQLAKQVNSLEEKGITIIGVQATKVDKSQLNEWVKRSNIPFPIGQTAGDEEKVRFTWGVKSMPWLILTDKHHKVIASGFSLTELDDKIRPS